MNSSGPRSCVQPEIGVDDYLNTAGAATTSNASNATIGKVEGYSPSLRHLVAALLFFFGARTGLSL